MNTVTPNPAFTFESVWAAIHETDRFIKEKQAETDRQMKETFHYLKDLQAETYRKREERDRLFKEEREESDRRFKEEMKERDRLLKEEREESDRRFKEEMKERDRLLNEKMAKTDEQIAKTGRQIDKTNEQIGGISRSNGEFCEEYFVNVYKENPVFMGEKFDRVLENVKPDPDLAVINDQYDLILRNGKTLVLIEMKYNAKVDDVGRMFRKLKTYRANYPMFKDYKTYLCLASFRFSATVRARAEEKGIVLIQQKGEINEVISENLKTW